MKFWSKINVVRTLFQLPNIYHLIITLLRKRQFLSTRYFVYILANSDFMVCLCTKLNFVKVKGLVFNVKKRKVLICSYTFCYKTNYWYWHNMQNFLFSLKYDKYHRVWKSFQIETKLKNWSNILFIKYILSITKHLYIYKHIYIYIVAYT